MVRADVRMAARSGMSACRALSGVQSAPQFVHLVFGQVSELSGFQRPQLDGPDPYASQFLHQAPEMLEHETDLLIAPLEQPHLIPGVLGVADQPQASRQRALSGD